MPLGDYQLVGLLFVRNEPNSVYYVTGLAELPVTSEVIGSVLGKYGVSDFFTSQITGGPRGVDDLTPLHPGHETYVPSIACGLSTENTLPVALSRQENGIP